ncbi:cytochrome P450 11B1, mitochondrial isoform X3 [Cricetulus griseus]|uniref:steroid 11beta-monooxygenase n=1 Tax=Cricetulus griseus TaxID=10029 RepID=A0A9J7FG93_CRIGR|nr:cytochrome P450 11B1, mitochondrial isoform X3 [Cricetulus griseus]
MALRAKTDVWLARPWQCLHKTRSLGTTAALPPNTLGPFESIPQYSRNRWLKMIQILREQGQENLHLEMHQAFQELGPIFRYSIGSTQIVSVMLPQDAEKIFQVDNTQPCRMPLEPWIAHREHRGLGRGVFLLNGPEWRLNRLRLNPYVLSPKAVQKFVPMVDMVARDFLEALKKKVLVNAHGSLSMDFQSCVFNYTIEASHFVLFGKRLGLLGYDLNPGSLKFIHALHSIMKTTPQLMFLPSILTRLTTPLVWKENFESWDIISEYVTKYVSDVYQEMKRGRPKFWSVISELIAEGALPMDAIQANSLELTAGSVDTALSCCCLFGENYMLRLSSSELPCPCWDGPPHECLLHGPKPCSISKAGALHAPALAGEEKEFPAPGLRLWATPVPGEALGTGGDASPAAPCAEILQGGDTRARGCADGLPLCFDAQLQPPPHFPACKLVSFASRVHSSSSLPLS